MCRLSECLQIRVVKSRFLRFDLNLSVCRASGSDGTCCRCTGLYGLHICFTHRKDRIMQLSHKSHIWPANWLRDIKIIQQSDTRQMQIKRIDVFNVHGHFPQFPSKIVLRLISFLVQIIIQTFTQTQFREMNSTTVK